MKKALLLTISLLCIITAMAGDITPAEALALAQQFTDSRMAASRSYGQTGATKQVVTVAGEMSGLYLFNIGRNEGFVVVSNDDRTASVLGYSESGSLNSEEIPQNMRAWLQGYADEIAWLKQHNGEFAAKVPARVPSALKSPIDPLITSTWDQSAPYNNLCPVYSGNSRSATGCVATAMAQVMNYHQWPNATTADIPSYTTTNSYKLKLDSIPEGTVLDWNNMLDNYYNVNYNDAQAAAVAQLMLCCGVSIRMNYGPSSGAYTHKVVSALKDYFDYNETATFLKRSFYSYSDWVEIMYHELVEGRPVVLGGTSTGGGHEFVCDGYQDEDYFHINWGWSGTSDGYFKLSALDPDQQGIGGSNSTDGFHYNQDAAIGIQKPTDNGTIYDAHHNNVNLHVNHVTFSEDPRKNDPVEVIMMIANNSDDDYDGDIIIRVYEGNSISYSYEDAGTFQIAAHDSAECILSFTPADTIIYRVYVYGPSETPGYLGTLNGSYSVKVGQPLVTTTSIDLAFNRQVENSKDSTGFFGNKMKGAITFINNTDEHYKARLGILVQCQESTVRTITSYYETVTIRAHQSKTLSIEAPDLEYGKDYRLAASYVRDGYRRYSYGDYMTCLRGIVTHDSDGNEVITEATPIYTVPDGTTVVDLRDTGVDEVITNNEPNCIYIAGSNDNVHDDLANVVYYDGTNYTAESITLTDNKNFYAPVAFSVTDIEFTYTFTSGADGSNGWNTIMLPFDVTEVTADGEPIDWFHSSSDTGKRFWVKEFTSDAVGKVYFDFATEMKANTPYIVAFPGSHWGSEWDLSGKTIKFKGKNITVSQSNDITSLDGNTYRFIGSTRHDNTENIYTMNDLGNSFVLKATGGSDPFRAYFTTDSSNSRQSVLAIGSEENSLTAITAVSQRAPEIDAKAVIVNIKGQRILTPRKGLYIMNGKKMVVK